MENQKIDLLALATEITSKLTAMHESLATLTTTVMIVAEADSTLYHDSDRVSSTAEGREIYGDYRLSSALSQALRRVNDALADPHWGGAVGDIAKAVEQRDQEYERANRYRTEEAQRAAREANYEAAKTAEHVESGFALISAFTKKIMRTHSRATVLYMVDGTLFEVTEEFNPKTNEFCRGERNLAVIAFNRITNEVDQLFKAEMTSEEIGKAAHLRDSIISNLRHEIGPVKIAA
ncbi:hypothetical protein [Rhizobium phaseoli]|uniref:Uncharacterized protein n=1 Tax=Rhizobium phaseoli TaxID=396 RepID=A0ABN4QNJ1_9HYPH|nr:hypothetical protein [Rhizobium phaseoli]ANL87120.1 hypothetical protein AMC81_PA00099 [Rhizobium phaseoli]ANL93629.1 hypothetical protein AMC80_PA00099 [Rhizobium phaseoli]